MANGQPRPAFYVAVFAVVLGLVGLAIWRYGGGSGAGTGIFSKDELSQVAGKAESPDSSGITTVKEYKYVAASKLPAVPRAGDSDCCPYCHHRSLRRVQN